MANNKIYLAGPDVFRSNAFEHFEKLKNACRLYGFEGMSPFDNEDFTGVRFSKDHSKSIFKSNRDLIKECDIIIANLIPFRGACIDDGTVWEIAYGYSLNKVLAGYTPYCNITLSGVICETFNINLQPEFTEVENFGNCCNLMIYESIMEKGIILKSFDGVLRWLEKNYEK